MNRNHLDITWLQRAASAILIGIACFSSALAQDSQAIFVCTNGADLNRDSFKNRLDQWSSLKALVQESGISIANRFYDPTNRVIEAKIARLSKNSSQKPLMLLFSGAIETDGRDIRFGDKSLSFSMQTLIERFQALKSKTEDSVSQLILVADCYTTQKPSQFISTLEPLLAKSPFSVHVAAAFHTDKESLDEKSLLCSAIDALEFDHSCDKDGNSEISTAELFQYFQSKVGKDKSVFRSSAMDLTLHKLLQYPESNLQSALTRVAGQVAQLCENEGIHNVAVLPFYSFSDDMESLPRSGTLARYLAERIERELIHRYQISFPVLLDDLQSQLDTHEITPIELSDKRTVVAETLAEACFLDGGFLFAGFRFERDAAGQAFLRQLNPELLILRNGKLVSKSKLDTVETAITQQQLKSVSPREQIAMMRVDRINEDLRSTPPMLDANFYPRLYMMVDETRIDPVYENDEMIVPVNAGERYKIVVDNSGGDDCFIQLLVDGKNTLPERPVPTAEKREPAVRVDLQDARTWFCKKGSVTVYEGFYSEIQANHGFAATYAFQVSQNPPTNAIKSGDVGQITMAIYAPVEKGRVSMGAVANYCTILGERDLAKIESYTGKRMPDKLPRQIIYLHYGY